MALPDRSEQFVQHLTGVQGQLFSYIMSMLPDADRASEVLQETNLVLWRKREEFDWNTRFATWACGVARFQVLAFLRDKGREKLHFNEALVQKLADEALPPGESRFEDDRQQALRGCLGKLDQPQRKLLESRYGEGVSVKIIAEANQKTVGSISQALFRIRRTLLRCLAREIEGAANR